MSDSTENEVTAVEDLAFEPGTAAHTAEWFRKDSIETLGFVPAVYVENIGWHVWDGKVWQPDGEGLRLKELLHPFIRRLHSAAIGQLHGRKYTLNGGYISDVIGALQMTTWVEPKSMDALPSYLNCNNGVLDLTTFTLEPHDPAMNMTMITKADYTGKIDPLWTSFIEEILPDQEIREYLQRLIGVSLLGEVLEHTLPILQGSGANGKSTIMNAVVKALGTYARAAESTLLMSGAGDAQSAAPATMMLRGKRLVITSETEEGKKLASAFVKQITGGDMLSARALHKMPVTWVPTHSVFLLTNPMPVVDGSDKALFRRLKVIQFKVIFPEDKMDPHLSRKLELLDSSILSWAAEGLKDYQQNGGIREPASVTGATNEYRGDNDAVASFLANLEFGAGTITVQELRHLLHDFQQDVDPKYKITTQRLNRALVESGAAQSRLRIDGKPTSVWNGVKIKE